MINISGVLVNDQRMIMNSRRKCCGNCEYFAGEPGDGVQFCDERETETHEDDYCGRWSENKN